jgi:hypothetical protein
MAAFHSIIYGRFCLITEVRADLRGSRVPFETSSRREPVGKEFAE